MLDKFEIRRERFIVHVVYDPNWIRAVGRKLCQLTPVAIFLLLLELLFRDRASF